MINISEDYYEKKILDALMEHSKGLTIKQIAEKIGSNRLTTSKYLGILLAKKKLKMRIIGPAKLYSLR